MVYDEQPSCENVQLFDNEISRLYNFQQTCSYK